jgi:hypothetical protein
MRTLFIALAFGASCIFGFSQGVLLGPGQSYVFEFSCLPYSRPSKLTDGGSVWAYFNGFGAGDRVELALYASSLADTPLISTYAPASIPLDTFLARWLPGMREDLVLVGPNWDAHLCGLEVEPQEITQKLS